MEWSDEGLVLLRRRHGETNAVVTLFTQAHGRHLGLVRGGSGQRHAGTFQLGNVVAARWRARLEEQLGSYVCELAESVAAHVLDDPGRLEALAACAELLDAVLPERHAYPELYAATRALVTNLTAASYASDLVRWELGLLMTLGFGLDLTACAATGQLDELAYVSPRTGRAVSREAGRALSGRLLELPAFLTGPRGAQTIDDSDIAAGLVLTGHFLERHLLAPARRVMPPSRLRLVDRWSRAARLRPP